MNEDWNKFLINEGINLNDIGEDKNTIPDSFITPLFSFNLLEITGNEAETFLQGQFTSNIDTLASGQRQISAWCNPKGKVITTFFIYRIEDRYLILLPAPLADEVHRRLQMYILRADVQINHHSEKNVMIGIRGKVLLEQLFPNNKPAFINDSIFFLPVPDPETQRWIAIAPPEKIRSLWERIKPNAGPVNNDYWHLLDIRAGIPWLNGNTTEQFLPQELNLEELGGLTYSKGCYPGQEVIARVHYRGKSKQQMYRATVVSDTLPRAGMKLYSEDTQQDLGMVLQAVMLSEKTFYLLVTTNIEYAMNKSVHLEDQNGPVLVFKSPTGS